MRSHDGAHHKTPKQNQKGTGIWKGEKSVEIQIINIITEFLYVQCHGMRIPLIEACLKLMNRV
jgi:hypothetical protein